MWTGWVFAPADGMNCVRDLKHTGAKAAMSTGRARLNMLCPLRDYTHACAIRTCARAGFRSRALGAYARTGRNGKEIGES